MVGNPKERGTEKQEKELTMSKIVVVSVAVVLMAGSSAFGYWPCGGLNQIQNTTVGLENTVQLLRGDPAANARQTLAVHNEQFSETVRGAYAGQALAGCFAQVGHASGNCGSVGVLQGLDVMARQAQLVHDGFGPKTQVQCVGLVAEQGVAKTQGPGEAEAQQQIRLVAGQEASNAAGTMSQSSMIIGLQKADVSGAAAATAGNTMNVTTVQSQATF
jgi:hypothetical protein